MQQNNRTYEAAHPYADIITQISNVLKAHFVNADQDETNKVAESLIATCIREHCTPEEINSVQRIIADAISSMVKDADIEPITKILETKLPTLKTYLRDGNIPLAENTIARLQQENPAALVSEDLLLLAVIGTSDALANEPNLAAINWSDESESSASRISNKHIETLAEHASIDELEQAYKALLPSRIIDGGGEWAILDILANKIENLEPGRVEIIEENFANGLENSPILAIRSNSSNMKPIMPKLPDNMNVEEALTVDDSGSSPLMVALRTGDTEFAEKIIDQAAAENRTELLRDKGYLKAATTRLRDVEPMTEFKIKQWINEQRDSSRPYSIINGYGLPPSSVDISDRHLDILAKAASDNELLEVYKFLRSKSSSSYRMTAAGLGIEFKERGPEMIEKKELIDNQHGSWFMRVWENDIEQSSESASPQPNIIDHSAKTNEGPKKEL